MNFVDGACQRARTIGSPGAPSSFINKAGFSASDAGRGASYFASDWRSLVERTKFASSYATTPESRYLTARPSRTKRMYEPVTGALRSVFTLSWCREANCFSVRKISSRASAADGPGSRRINLSASSKISFVWN